MARYRAHRRSQVREAEAALMATVPEGTLMQRAAAGLASACATFLGGVVRRARPGARRLGFQRRRRLVRGRARWPAVAPRSACCRSDERIRTRARCGRPAAGGRVVDGPPAHRGPRARRHRRHRRGQGACATRGRGRRSARLDRADRRGRRAQRRRGRHRRGRRARTSAELTVTFGTYKVGLLVDPAAAAAGVGRARGHRARAVPRRARRRSAAAGRRTARWCRVPGHDAQKYSRGVVGIRAGSQQFTGAGRAGDRRVRCDAAWPAWSATPGASESLVRAPAPEVVVGSGRVQAWVVGSGLGPDRPDLVAEILDAGPADRRRRRRPGRLPARFEAPSC